MSPSPAARLRRTAASLLGRRARLRWVHLVLGGALLMPYQLFTSTLLVPALFHLSVGSEPAPAMGLSLTLAGPLLAATGLLAGVRTLEGSAARALHLTDEPELLLSTPATTRPARLRTAAWFTTHLTLGGIIGGISLAAPPAGVVLLALPLLDRNSKAAELPWGRPFLDASYLAPPVGLALLALPVLASWAAGSLLARLAPALLGPTPADRLAQAEQRARHLAERNRLARELHDSIGHALSAVTLQAGAAGRVLGTNPEFAARALAAIEETARDAAAELDHVLGLLREEDPGNRQPTATLTELEALIERTRAAGTPVTLHTDHALDRLPPVISRETYRITQEGLGNALRHAAPGSPVRLRIEIHDKHVELSMTNAIPRTPRNSRRNGRAGGHGLHGIAERVALLHGTLHSGPEAGPEADGTWRLHVTLPLGSRNPE